MKNKSPKPTIKDIAAMAKVSLRTVSLAIHGEGRMSEATRGRILKITADCGYRPNIMARGLASGRTYLLGVVLPFVNISFYDDVLSGIEEGCRDNFYDLILKNSRNDPAWERRALQRLVDRHVDGLVFYPDYRCYEAYHEILQAGVPIVQISGRLLELAAPCVVVDNVDGGCQATSHLIQLGHRHIAHIGRFAETSTILRLRRDGYRKALVEKGVRIDLDRYEREAVGFEEGKAAALSLLRDNPEVSAIFAASDHTALGAIAACLELGKDVPGDVSVVGFDDLEIGRLQMAHPLTTVSQPKAELGRAAAELVFRLMQGEKCASVVLRPALVARGTSAPPRQ